MSNTGDINVGQPDFIKALNAQLTTTPISDWQSVLALARAECDRRLFAEEVVRRTSSSRAKYLHGTPEMQPRWKRCVQWVLITTLGEALGQVFVEKTFTAETKARTRRR